MSPPSNSNIDRPRSILLKKIFHDGSVGDDGALTTGSVGDDGAGRYIAVQIKRNVVGVVNSEQVATL